MAAPIKPWETNNLHNHAFPTHIGSASGASADMVPSAAIPTTNTLSADRPPLPPRPTVSTLPVSSPFPMNSGGMGMGMGAGYGAGGYGGYGGSMYGAGTMGGYGSYGMMSGYRGGYGDTNTFVTQAESSARGAFQSVESVVAAVSSVSMMLESTYYALHNSFRAVLGVADQFSRLKLQLTHLAASFAAFRFLRWLYRRLLVLLRLKSADVSEDVWNAAVKKTAREASAAFPGATGGNKASWPIILFFTIAVGGPYLIWRMLRNMASTSNGWANGTLDHVVGEALYDFTSDREDELCFRAGDRMNLAPAEMQPRLRENDWLLACLDGERTGLVPASYIRILGKRRGKPQTQTHPNMEQVFQQAGSNSPISDHVHAGGGDTGNITPERPSTH